MSARKAKAPPRDPIGLDREEACGHCHQPGHYRSTCPSAPPLDLLKLKRKPRREPIEVEDFAGALSDAAAAVDGWKQISGYYRREAVATLAHALGIAMPPHLFVEPDRDPN